MLVALKMEPRSSARMWILTPATQRKEFLKASLAPPKRGPLIPEELAAKSPDLATELLILSPQTQTLNPQAPFLNNNSEEAVWAMLCEAQQLGFVAAQQQMTLESLGHPLDVGLRGMFVSWINVRDPLFLKKSSSSNVVQVRA